MCAQSLSFDIYDDVILNNLKISQNWGVWLFERKLGIWLYVNIFHHHIAIFSDHTYE